MDKVRWEITVGNQHIGVAIEVESLTKDKLELISKNMVETFEASYANN